MGHWQREVDALVAGINPESYPKLEAALADADRQDKEAARREMGLPE
jgi:hypothetical protein